MHIIHTLSSRVETRRVPDALGIDNMRHGRVCVVCELMIGEEFYRNEHRLTMHVIVRGLSLISDTCDNICSIPYFEGFFC